jgi:tetratricopeptide (TPR) repeat protein
MAKKKRQPPKKGPKLSKPKKGPAEDSPPFLDPLVLRAFMESVMSKMPDAEPRDDSPLGRAQELVSKAFEESSLGRRKQLANQALRLSPDCADAYALLAQSAKTRKEGLTLWEQAVAAGERALGPEYFEQARGEFWRVLETRPYMRAREGLAHALWLAGRHQEAVDHLQNMLRLNPGDNQGLRYTLGSWLLSLDRDDELANLLDQFSDEDSAAWSYAKTLLSFRKEGDSPQSRQRLKQARRSNKYVPLYLLGDEPIPMTPPDYYGRGDESEAILYAADSLSAWRSTPGAVTWLRSRVKTAKKRKTSSAIENADGPLPLIKERLKRVEQEFDVWQADVRPVATWIETAAGERVRPWLVMIVSQTTSFVLGSSMFETKPDADHVWDIVAKAIEVPSIENPHRPSSLEIGRDPLWAELSPHFDQLGISVDSPESLETFDTLLEDLTKHLSEGEPPGMLDMPGVSPEAVGQFFDAAASFFGKGPWKLLGSEQAIRISCDRFESGPWYAVIMGQSGLTLGLALYEDIKLLQRMWSDDVSDEDNARRTVALTVTYDLIQDAPPLDIDAAEKYHWELAGPEAFPSFFRKERGLSTRPPLAWELGLMEACLRALPTFVARYRPDETTEHRFTLPTSTGELTLALRWVEEAE